MQILLLYLQTGDIHTINLPTDYKSSLDDFLRVEHLVNKGQKDNLCVTDLAIATIF